MVGTPQVELAQYYVSKADTLSDVLNRHKNVFDKGLRTIKGLKVGTELQDGAKPVFYKAQPVPYALCQKVEEEFG